MKIINSKTNSNFLKSCESNLDWGSYKNLKSYVYYGEVLNYKEKN